MHGGGQAAHPIREEDLYSEPVFMLVAEFDVIGDERFHLIRSNAVHPRCSVRLAHLLQFSMLSVALEALRARRSHRWGILA